MKRLLALAAIVLIGLTGCLPYTEGNPNATESPTAPAPALPPIPSGMDVPPPEGFVGVTFEVRIYDEEGDEVFGEFEAEMKLTGILTPDSPEDAVRYADLIDQRTGLPVPSPHEWVTLLPYVQTQYVEAGEVASVTVEAKATLGPWWHMNCRVSVDGITVYQSDNITNDSALPIEDFVICIWP